LNDNTDGENGASKDNSLATADSISQPAVEQHTNPGTKFENRSQKTLFDTRAAGIVRFDLLVSVYVL
jgi:hypothetical protein